CKIIIHTAGGAKRPFPARNLCRDLEREGGMKRQSTSGAVKKIQAYRRGLRAETQAAWWLRCKGYRILARRWLGGGAEVDIIARRGKTLCVVEVKARPSVEEAIAAITPAKQRQLLRGVEAYLARH